MKKRLSALLCLALLALCACGQKNDTMTGQDAPYSYVLNAYRNYRRGEGWRSVGFKTLPGDEPGSISEDWTEEQLDYALYDMDGKGTKALLLGVGSDQYNSICAVYTIENGVAVQQHRQAYCDEGGYTCLLKNGTIFEQDLYAGVFDCYRFEDGKLKLKFDGWSRIDADGKKVDISDDEVRRLAEEYEGRKNGELEYAKLDWKPLDGYRDWGIWAVLFAALCLFCLYHAIVSHMRRDGPRRIRKRQK